ncbi:rhodanese-like domain-containing protein [Catellicoccus marimammalium]|uniref:Rhodanese-like domain-containing protein n=1 Tax=Catellicoccus marimammalium M35/04/3 TaxID=1234409 RepID=K8ZPM1_9ENTE|nr:rhodanese-like domain-containing protein [Catellicoccus marimammalium]EKU27506.1 Rhodanese-like domain-containing protein [Catellicoccus marimammalium M35/04/3]
MQEITVKEFLAQSLENPKIIDVREIEEYEEGHMPQAMNYPLSEINDWATTLDKNEHYYLICRSGYRSHNAGLFLEEKGYEVTNLLGGMLEYTEIKQH